MAKTKIGKVGMTPKGEYSSGKSYVRLDVVTKDGNSYVCIKNSTGISVTNTEYWQLLAQKGEKGDKPTNGIDYNTEQEKTDFKNEVVEDTKADIVQFIADKKTELGEYEDAKENELSSKASDLTDVFNKNVTSKTNTFNKNSDSKITEFNTNASGKTEDYNDNASAKTTEYDENATAKVEEYNNNTVTKLEEYNANATSKVNEFNENVNSIEDELTQLANQMPWKTTELAKKLQVTDSAEYGRNKLKLFGDTEQESTTGVQLVDFNNPIKFSANTTYTFENDTLTVKNGSVKYAKVSYDFLEIVKHNPGKTIYFRCKEYDYKNAVKSYVQLEYVINGTRKYSPLMNDTGTHYSYTIPDDCSGITSFDVCFYSNNSIDEIPSEAIWVEPIVSFNVDSEYETYTGGQASPNPDYPQEIKTVTGTNIVKVRSKNLFNKDNTNNLIYGLIRSSDSKITSSVAEKILIFKCKSNTTYTISKINSGRFRVMETDEIPSVTTTGYNLILKESSERMTYKTTTGKFLAIGYYYANSSIENDEQKILDSIQIEEGEEATEYEPYRCEEYELNLGDMELCKINDYADLLFKNEKNNKNYNKELKEGFWYKKKLISKKVYDGTETNWRLDSSGTESYYYLLVEDLSMLNNAPKALSNKYLYKQVYSSNTNQGFYITSGDTNQVRVRYGQEVTLDKFKQLLKEEPLVIYYILKIATYEEITDTTLIEQLEKMHKIKLHNGTNNIYVESEDGLTPDMQLTYMQDMNKKISDLETRLELLESEV